MIALGNDKRDQAIRHSEAGFTAGSRDRAIAAGNTPKWLHTTAAVRQRLLAFMTGSERTPANPDADAPRLRAELEQRDMLVQQIRRDLIQSQISLLELHDTILQKETDRADAVSILGELEHVLEEKINYIMDLDRELNGRIRSLEQRLADESSERESTTRELVQKLDATNRELGATHTMAAGLVQQLDAATNEGARLGAELVDARKELGDLRPALASAREDLRNLQGRLDRIQSSFSWKVTGPLRAIRRLFTR